MKVNALSFFSVVLLGILALPAPAATADFSQGKSHVEFEAIGRPSMLKIQGDSDQALQGSLQLEAGKITGQCSFTLESLTTGIAMRDDHMKHRYLETQKYPLAK